MKTALVVIHIGGAMMALVCGMLALSNQNGSKIHRMAGKLYSVGWVMLFVAGIGLGVLRQGFSAFQVLNMLGMGFVVRGYTLIFRRAALGRVWLQKHYSAMLTSMVFLCVATANQLLMRGMGTAYPWWGIVVLSVIPIPITSLLMRRFNRRYGFEPSKPLLTEAT